MPTGGKLVLLYVLTLVAFLAIDAVWLTLVARTFYQKNLADLMRPDIRFGVAFLFYVLFVVGVLVFAVWPGVEAASLGKAVLFGALFGFLAYATYDLTNLSTLKGWPVIVSVVDMAWGATLSALTATAGYYIARWLA